MADMGFNGSTITFGGTSVLEVTGISSSSGGNPVDVTSSGKTTHVFTAGVPTVEFTVDVVGIAEYGTTSSQTAISVNSTGAIVITWNDGTTDSSITAAIVTNVERTGSLDSPITSSITFAPYGG